MDFIFEDESDDVGSDVEAYCPKCKGDTTHVVISKYEDEIRRVQCNPCGDVHSFRKPRGEVEDDMPEPVAARKRALQKKYTWQEFFNKHGEKTAHPYEFRQHYRENQIVSHPKFGKGFVSEVVSDSKVELTFADARRILVHNRRDIPGLPLAAEGDGKPTPKNGAKGKAKAAPPVKAAPPSKAVAPVAAPGKGLPKVLQKKGAPAPVAAPAKKMIPVVVASAKKAVPAGKAPTKPAVKANGAHVKVAPKAAKKAAPAKAAKPVAKAPTKMAAKLAAKKKPAPARARR